MMKSINFLRMVRNFAQKNGLDNEDIFNGNNSIIDFIKAIQDKDKISYQEILKNLNDELELIKNA